MSFPESPLKEIVAGLLVLAGAFAAARGTRRLVRGLGQAVPLDVIRGIRGWCIAFALAAVATGLLVEQWGFVVLGAVFLAEELYETGLVTAIIRSGGRDPSQA